MADSITSLKAGASLAERAEVLGRMARDLQTTPHPGGSLLELLAALVDACPQPDSHLFADVDGCPLPAAPSSQPAVEFQHAVLAFLAALSALTQRLAGGDLSALATAADPDAPHFGGHPDGSADLGSSRVVTEIRIEELPSDEDPSLCARLLLAVGLFATCQPLPTPWAPSATASAAQQLLCQLAARLDGVLDTPLAAAHAAGLAGRAAAREASSLGRMQVQRLVLCMLPLALQQLRPSLLVAPNGKRSAGRVDTAAEQGPPAFQRCLAGTQLAWLLCQLDQSALSSALPLALPCLLACLHDPSPPVLCCGLRALQHCAAQGALKWQGELLLDRLISLLTGCAEGVWPAAAATAVAVVKAVEGVNPYAKGYTTILGKLLTEVERQPSKPERAAPFLLQLPLLASCLGLQLVPHFPRLLPLLLGWVSAPAWQEDAVGAELDALLEAWTAATDEGAGVHMARGGPGRGKAENSPGTAAEAEEGGSCGSRGRGRGSVRVLALRGLYEVMRYTWPRMPAHAEVTWRHLEPLLRPPGADSLGVQQRAQRVHAEEEHLGTGQQDTVEGQQQGRRQPEVEGQRTQQQQQQQHDEEMKQAMGVPNAAKASVGVAVLSAAATGSGSGEDSVEFWAARCAEVLYCCGGAALQAVMKGDAAVEAMLPWLAAGAMA
ncbi:hypothetical protein N2152v2_001056 [Parachlorella kessleri]